MNQSAGVYLGSVRDALDFNEIVGGVIKPLIFGFIVAIVGCYMGLSTEGGTVGVGRSTTRSVVISSITIILSNFVLTRLILALLLER